MQVATEVMMIGGGDAVDEEKIEAPNVSHYVNVIVGVNSV